MNRRLPWIAMSLLLACGGAVTAVAPIIDDEDKPDAGKPVDGGLRETSVVPTTDASDAADASPRIPPPTFAPNEGTFTSSQLVVVRSPIDGGVIRYTTDGTDPSPTQGSVYEQPVPVVSTTTIRAIVVVDGRASSVAAGTWVINICACATQPVQATPDPGELYNTSSVQLITPTVGSTLCYTLNGTAPGCTTGSCANSITYDGSFEIGPTSNATTHVRTIACSLGNSPSDVVLYTYTFKVAPIDVDGGPTSYHLQTATRDGTIRYGTNDASCEGLCPNDSTCTECVPGAAGCQTGVLEAGVPVHVIGCKSSYQPSREATITP